MGHLAHPRPTDGDQLPTNSRAPWRRTPTRRPTETVMLAITMMTLKSPCPVRANAPIIVVSQWLFEEIPSLATPDHSKHKRYLSFLHRVVHDCAIPPPSPSVVPFAPDAGQSAEPPAEIWECGPHDCEMVFQRFFEDDDVSNGAWLPVPDDL